MSPQLSSHSEFQGQVCSNYAELCYNYFRLCHPRPRYGGRSWADARPQFRISGRGRSGNGLNQLGFSCAPIIFDRTHLLSEIWASFSNIYEWGQWPKFLFLSLPIANFGLEPVLINWVSIVLTHSTIIFNQTCFVSVICVLSSDVLLWLEKR